MQCALFSEQSAYKLQLSRLFKVTYIWFMCYQACVQGKYNTPYINN